MPVASGPYTLTQVPEANIELTSTKFNTIRRIPVEYTCTKESKYNTSTGTTTHGQEWSPPLAWDSVPEGTKSIAIIMDDPDVSIVKDIWGQVSHATAPHEYSFKIYALDIEVDLAAGSSKNDLLRAMDGHILGIGEIKGEYVPQHKGL